MDASQVEGLLQAALSDCRIEVEGDGSHYSVLAVGECFDGLRAVQRQQLVYGALKEQIADGSVHAVNIRAMTPAEWDARG